MQLLVHTVIYFLFIYTQGLPCCNGGERVAKLYKDACEDGDLVDCQPAGNCVGKCCDCAC